MKESNAYRLFTYLNGFILIAIVFLTLFPFLNVVAQSFSGESQISSGEIFLWPKGFNIATYKAVMGDKMFWINYKNTVIYTVTATSISMILTTLFAYAVSRKRLLGRSYIVTFAVITMFFNGGLIPNYILINSLGLTNTIFAVVLPGALSVYNMLIMKSFFESLPVELEEAASIDGASTYHILWNIILPLSKPILATMILFYSVTNWNTWFGAFLYLDKKELFPVTIYLRNLIMASTAALSTGGVGEDNLSQIQSNIKAVTMVLTILPIITVYPFIQKYFVKGVMIGAVKQ